MVAPAQADGSKRALLSQPTISLKGSGPSHRAWAASASAHPPAGLHTAESGHSKAEVRLYRLFSVSQFTGKEAVRGASTLQQWVFNLFQAKDRKTEWEAFFTCVWKLCALVHGYKKFTYSNSLCYIAAYMETMYLYCYFLWLVYVCKHFILL